MSSKQEHPIQAMGFWMFGFLSVVLAVLKLTVAGYWSWWRVMVSFEEFSPTHDFLTIRALDVPILPCAHTMMWSAGSASPRCTTRW